MTKFIVYDVLILDTETKKIYTFTPCEHTVSEMNNELKKLTYDEIDDVKNCNQLNTSYIYSSDINKQRGINNAKA